MARIDLHSVHVEFPIYNINARSFKKDFLRIATGGKVSKDNNNHIVVSALSNITLTFQEGDRVGVIGHNGAGKSSLLRLIANIYEPTRGNIKIAGNISSMLNLKSGMQMELTGYENITIKGIIAGLTPQEIEMRTKEIAELTGLGDYLAMPIRTYSSGMLIRLAFAITTNIKPEILLLDEIFGAGDADFMQLARKKMISLLDESSIVVMVNHSDKIISDFCNKALLLEGGCIKYFGSVEKGLEIYNKK
jgi:ABC-type polysaccharide/polyol phosphate transport system ATPase subunit